MAERKGPETDASKRTQTSEELAESKTGKEGAEGVGTGRPGVGATPVGTTDEVATQGFTGVKVQADQQASNRVGDSATKEGEEVPMGENPLKDDTYRRADARENTREFTVADNKFHFGGDSFSKGDKIHLTAEEYQRVRGHLVEKNVPKKDEGHRVIRETDEDKK